MCCGPDIGRRCEVLRVVAIAAATNMAVTHGLWLPAAATGRTFPASPFLPWAGQAVFGAAVALEGAALAGLWSGLLCLIVLPAVVAGRLASAEQHAQLVRGHCRRFCQCAVFVAGAAIHFISHSGGGGGGLGAPGGQEGA